MTEHDGDHGPAFDRLARWALRLGDHEVLHLSCTDATADPGAAGTWIRWGGCLGGVEMPDLVTLAAIAPRLVLHLGTCRHQAASTPARAAAFLEHLGLGHRLRVQDGVTPARRGTPAVGSDDRSDSLPLSRRDLLPWVRRERGGAGAGAGREQGVRWAAGAARRAPVPSAGHGEAGPQVRLAAALRELSRQEAPGVPRPDPTGDRMVTPGADEPTAAPHPVPRPSAHQLASAGCTACQTCVRACPTSALELRKGAKAVASGDASLTLVLERSACIGCLRCLSLCPVGALSDEGPIGWGELCTGPVQDVLEEVRVRPCARCRTPFAGEGDLCQVCEMRQENPFGSWLPPGYVAPRVYAPPSSGPEGD